MTTHTLKIWPEWFDLLIHRRKEFELRKDDRYFKEGDIIRLCEYLPDSKKYTGCVALARITFITKNAPGLMPGYVAMGILFLNLEVKHNSYQEVDL